MPLLRLDSGLDIGRGSTNLARAESILDPPAMKYIPIEQLTYTAFAALQKEKFRVHLDASNSIELELVQALVSRSRVEAETDLPEANQESFSLLFRGPDTRFLPQQTYRFEQEKLGQFDLFIVPVGQVPGSYEYQAIFYRLPKATSEP